jgi:hypothetical protein
MAITEFRPQDQNQNPSQAPTLGEQSGTFGANAQQRRNISQQGGSGRFTNLQQYVQANEANNPNARLLQREAQTRQGELGTKQAQFTTQATPIKTGFETVRSGQQFVQSALQDPTQYVTPERLEQFAGYRTSGVGDIETPYNQLQNLRSGLGTQQEQLASGLETIKSTPTALQNFIQSQRVNPALATRGENVLDRFLTQSTQSGQEAIAGLGTTAGAIRQAQAPSISSDIEALRTQAQGQPLSSADVRNLITAQTNPEEEYIRSINANESKNLISRSMGKTTQELDEELADLNYRINKIKNTNAQRDRNIEEFRARTQGQKQQDINDLESRISSDPRSMNNRWVENERAKGRAEIEEKYSNNRIDLGTYQGEKYINDLLTSAPNIFLKDYESKINQIPNINKQRLLELYDPTRLSRVQALQQLAGTTQFNPLLQQRLS